MSLQQCTGPLKNLSVNKDKIISMINCNKLLMLVYYIFTQMNSTGVDGVTYRLGGEGNTMFTRPCTWEGQQEFTTNRNLAVDSD